MSRSDAALLSEAAQRLPNARKAMQAATGDMPSRGGCEGVSGGGTGEWGPTVTIAMNLGADEAVRDARRLDKLMLLMAARCRRHQPITQQLAEVVDICDRWAPTPRRRQAIEGTLRAAAEGKGDDGCLSCSRITNHRGVPVYEQQHPGLKVCKSCHDMLKRVRAHDRYVDAELVPLPVLQWRQRHAGKQVTDTILERLLMGRDA